METWTYSWAFRNLLAELLMPPGIWLVGILLALFLFKKRAILQKVSVTFFVMMLWLSSTPAFVQSFTNVTDAWMHWPSPIQMHDHQAHIKQVVKNNSAIVVLGGGRRKGAIESPQYQNQDLSPYSLERLRMAARIASETKLPILLTGGAPDRTSDTDLPEAVVMAKILDREFHQTAKWVETKSQTTQENAALTADILKQDGIKNIYLVTHFWHMPRAQQIFEQYGLKVIPVAHGFHRTDKLNPTDFYPTSLTETRQIWHEIIGVIWYRLRY